MTTFISYSRVHSEFAVRLARDLKTAGFDVWLDQLDIPKGARWDDAIEAAVERSSIFMIVLAPESIESQNVKDELSYAIDSGKHILPVVIKPCKIPLRLRRFQYVDFTDKPYKDSLAEIKRLLGNTKRLVKTPPEELDHEQPVLSPVVPEPEIQREADPVPEPPKREESKQERPARKLMIPIVLIVIGIAGTAVGLTFAADRNVPPSATPTLNLPTTAPTDTLTLVPPPPQIIDDAGVTMRLVGAGPFTMGSESGFTDEKPVQTVYLDTFYIDKYEVTNAFYRACVDAGACLPPKEDGSLARVSYYAESEFDNYPAVHVDWNMARTYCEWRGARLPTEAEWEKAARGTDGRTYPWGEDISCNEANYFGCRGDVASVTSNESGLSVYGVYNLAGNVYEWVSSLYMAYPYDPSDGREDLNAVGERVLRGGSWLNSDSDNEVRSARRHMADPLTANDNIGFRCVLTPDGSAPETTQVTMTPLNSFTATSLAVTQHARKTREADESTAALIPVAGASNTVAASLTPVPAALSASTATRQPPTSTATDRPSTPTAVQPTDTDEPPPPPPTDTDEPPPPPPIDTDEPPPPPPIDTDEPPPPPSTEPPVEGAP